MPFDRLYARLRFPKDGYASQRRGFWLLRKIAAHPLGVGILGMEREVDSEAALPSPLYSS